MKPPPFDYLRPATVEEALQALAEAGDEARLLAGGQSLVPMLNMRLLAPRLLIDIGGMKDLADIGRDGSGLLVGAAVTQAVLAARRGLAQEVPLLAAALPHVGHYQTRGRGTVCGSIAHADPSAELPLCLVALGGEVLLRSAKEKRKLPAAAFFQGLLSTACRPDEMVEAVRFPRADDRAGYAFAEVSLRHGDFALVALAAIARKDRLVLAVGGVADRPVRREWPLLDPLALDDALNTFAWELGARDDQHATARYRRELVRRIGRRTIEEARARCQP